MTGISSRVFEFVGDQASVCNRITQGTFFRGGREGRAGQITVHIDSERVNRIRRLKAVYKQ
jgi:hypothetical protein